jgi:hypothetical protein
MEMYEASRFAFDTTVGQGEALPLFINGVYKKLLSDWDVFRPRSPSVCWSPQKIFETIKREFSPWAWGGSVSLLNVMSGDTCKSLLPRLSRMREIKPNKDYPCMTVSKFLHFYNPELFPVYDTEVIWKTVLEKRYRNEFREFCANSGLGYDVGDTPLFLRNYICWAGYLVSVAHAKFMELFVDWLGQQPGCDFGKWKITASTASKLYATAFEFTAIGAAEAEEDRSPAPLGKDPGAFPVCQHSGDTATEFNNDEEGCLAWLAAHPDGFVLNLSRTCAPGYIVLHRASCSSISNYTRMARPGGFTERQYAKVCAESEGDLRTWVQRHGRPDGSFTTRCQRCRP